MIIDGKAIATEIFAQVKESRSGLSELFVRAITVMPGKATESYLKIKAARAAEAGIRLEVVQLPDSANTNDVLQELEREGADAILVQLPLPPAIDTKTVLDAIPRELDADVLSSAAQAAFVAGEADALLPPVVGAVKEILERTHIAITGKHAVVIGEGGLVGKPSAAWLRYEGATVTVLTRATPSAEFTDALREADIIVSGAGSPGLITPEMLSPGVVLIDAGTTEDSGALRGDADPACADIASVFTPVPGGVGPLTVACLFRNAALLVSGPHASERLPNA